MANNFRLTGDYYVSKEGSDANDGLTPETPKLTIGAALNLLSTTVTQTKTIIVGSGVYKETIDKAIIVNNSNISVIADSYAVLEANNSQDTHYINKTNGGNYFNFNFYNFEFRNAKEILVSAYGDGFSSTVNYINCIIKCNVNHANSITSTQYAIPLINFKNCVLINLIIGNQLKLQTFQFDKCILINTSVIGIIDLLSVGYGTSWCGGVTMFKNSYLDSTSVIYIYSVINNILAGGSATGTTVTNVTFSNFINNNIHGKIVATWNGAVSGANSRLIPLGFSQHRIDYPTFNVNSISANPLFNDAQKLNFTLQSSSPHIRAASDYTNIGGTEYAVYKSASSTEFTSGATISGLTLRGNNSYAITSSPTPGTLETAPISIQWPATKPLTKLEWSGVLEFNKSITAGTFGNNNVPDWDTYTTGAGASPDRLTVKMRFSTQQTQPTLSSHWDNGGYWTAGNYELFEVNQKPKVDSNGKGNGNPDYIETTGLGDIVPTWIQLNIKLIDTYNP